MRWISLACLLPLSAGAVDLPEAVRAAVARDPGVQAVQARVGELAGAARAAEGAFDLVGDFGLSWNTDRATTQDQTGTRISLDTQRLSLDAAVVQPLVWGTQVRAGWVNEFTSTDNPFRNCVPGVASDQCYESRLELVVTQPLMRGFGREINTLAEARVEAEAVVVAAQERVKVATLIEEVVAAWAELAYAQADVRIRKRALELAETQRSSAARQVEGGRMAPVDLAVVEQAVAERAQALFVAEQRVADQRARLEVRTGLTVATADLPEPPIWELDGSATATAAEAQSPELQVIKAQIARQATDLPALRDRTRVQLDLTVQAAQSGLGEGLGDAIAALPDNESSFYGAALALRFPFQNRVAEGELMQAEAALERAELERAAQVQAIQLAADAALRALHTAEQAQGLALKVASLAEVSLAAEQRRLELGRATQLDVLEVSQKAAEAALSVERARADRLLAAARLQNLTGRLLAAYGIALE